MRSPVRPGRLRSAAFALALFLPALLGAPSTAIARSSSTATAVLEGVDVSSYQGTIDWAKIAAAGKRFAFVRASGGSLDADSKYTVNRTRAKANGLAVGAYHFANPDKSAGDAAKEAHWFLSHANPTTGDLAPTLDLERNVDLTTGGLQRWVWTWLQTVEASTRIKPIIYTTPNFWTTSMGDTTAFSAAGYTVLWIANWNVSSPTVPGGTWGGKGWTFWQYTSRGQVSGISGQVDLDRYNGTTLAASLFIP